MLEAWDDGFVSYSKGTSLDANPYPRYEIDLHNAWVVGWQKAAAMGNVRLESGFDVDANRDQPAINRESQPNPRQQGYDAFLRWMWESGNPYQPEVELVNHHEWNNGWESAKLAYASQLIKAFDLGYDAFCQGLTLTANPHTAGTRHHSYWFVGWHKGNTEAQEEDD